MKSHADLIFSNPSDIAGYDMGLLRKIDRFSNNIVFTVVDVGNDTRFNVIACFHVKINNIPYRNRIGTFNPLYAKLTFDATLKESAIKGLYCIPTPRGFINRSCHIY